MRSEERPKISEFSSIPKFLQAMVEWRKRAHDGFSVRSSLKRIQGVSPALVSQLIAGQRKLTRERIAPISELLELRSSERVYLDRWVERERSPTSKSARKRSSPDNHLLQSWLHMYVKDAFSLIPRDAKVSRGMQQAQAVSAAEIQKRLGGIASIKNIERSIQFLLREGYLRRTVDGRIVKNDVLTITTDDVPNEKLRKFHKRALDLAKQGISKYPPEQRRSSTVLMNLSFESYFELRELLKNFYEQLLQFIESHPDEGDVLCQVGIHLTPIGGFNEPS